MIVVEEVMFDTKLISELLVIDVDELILIELWKKQDITIKKSLKNI